jgi:hypothetical protein
MAELGESNCQPAGATPEVDDLDRLVWSSDSP